MQPTVRQLLDSFGVRLESAFSSFGQICLGIDPSTEQLSAWGLGESLESLERFGKTLVDKAYGVVGIVKPQVAFFEQHGSKGFSVLEKLCERAHDAGLIVIADAKRGDIDSSMRGYQKAWLDREAPFLVDALTCSPYLGPESLEETVSAALANNRGIFVLGATSNNEAVEFQKSEIKGRNLVEQVIDFASKYRAEPMGSIGVVIGATVDFSSIESGGLRAGNSPILAPGFGAQGAKLEDVRRIFGSLSGQVICNVGRSVAGDGEEGLDKRLADAKNVLEEGLAVEF